MEPDCRLPPLALIQSQISPVHALQTNQFHHYSYIYLYIFKQDSSLIGLSNRQNPTRLGFLDRICGRHIVLFQLATDINTCA